MAAKSNTKMNEQEARHLLTLLRFDHETGIFYWNVHPDPRTEKRFGDIAGSINEFGRCYINLNYKYIQAPHLVWLLCYGELPSETLMVDHKDRNTENNRPDNLRLATRAQNTANGARSKNKKGVWKVNHRYRARCVRKHLGYFDTEQEALDAYDKAAIIQFGEFALTNKELREV